MQFFVVWFDFRADGILARHTDQLEEYECTQARLTSIINRQYGGDKMIYDWLMLNQECVQEMQSYQVEVAAWCCSCSLYRNASQLLLMRSVFVQMQSDFRVLRSVKFLLKYQSQPDYLVNDSDSSAESDLSSASSNKSHFSRHWHWQELWAQHRTPRGLDLWFRCMQDENFS
jgi:hypothetical protein